MSKIKEKDLQDFEQILKDEWFNLTDQQVLEEAEKLLNLTSLLLWINYKGYDK